MRGFIVALSMVLAVNIAWADDADDISAKMQEYFALFNAKDTDKIANFIYSTPVHIGGGDSHRILADPAAAMASLAGLYEQIEGRGWAESRIKELRVCIASATLALIGTRYSRLDADSQPIPPEIRSSLYVLQKLDDEWRIVAFYSHDGTVEPSCAM